MNLNRLYLAAAICLSTVGAAHANQTWAWSYSGAGVSASGTFVTAGSATTFEDIQSVTGSRNGAPILGLVPLDEDPDFGYDNQFNAVGEHFTEAGAVFDFGNALPHINLYVQSGSYLDLYIDAGGDPVAVPVSFNVTAVPEPATLLMMLAGLGLLGVCVRKSRSAA